MLEERVLLAHHDLLMQQVQQWIRSSDFLQRRKRATGSRELSTDLACSQQICLVAMVPATVGWTRCWSAPFTTRPTGVLFEYNLPFPTVCLSVLPSFTIHLSVFALYRRSFD
jgi:hypothetical protein